MLVDRIPFSRADLLKLLKTAGDTNSFISILTFSLLIAAGNTDSYIILLSTLSKWCTVLYWFLCFVMQIKHQFEFYKFSL